MAQQQANQGTANNAQPDNNAQPHDDNVVDADYTEKN